MNKHVNIRGVEIPWYFIVGVAVLTIAVAVKLVAALWQPQHMCTLPPFEGPMNEDSSGKAIPAMKTASASRPADTAPNAAPGSSDTSRPPEETAAEQNAGRVVDETLPSGVRVRQQIIEADTGERVSHGEYHSWYPNGSRRSQGEHCDGRREGRWTFWDESRRLLSHQTYVGGLPHGPFAVYHPGGEKARAGQLSRGMKHGPWTYWDPQGREIRQEQYDRGTPVGQWVHRDADGETWAVVQR